MVGYLSRRILPEVGVRARTCGEGLCVFYAGLHGIVKFTRVMEEVDRIRGFRAISSRWTTFVRFSASYQTGDAEKRCTANSNGKGA